MIELFKNKILSGCDLTDEEVMKLCDYAGDPLLREAAKEITSKLVDVNFDSCSIVNARSGNCPENCKWCAQSAHYSTKCTVNALITEKECLEAARHNKANGVKRFSLVTSGRAMKGASLDMICHMLGKVKEEVGIYTCASLGLLNREELQKLWDSGVRRYHCNLEAAPSFFGQLCTTHTIDDKIKTINAAREIGFEICSGGIIGMGEAMRQRAELAVALRSVHPHSIPVNILCPIKGTPLEQAEPIPADEILDTLSIFRMAHPKVQIRFAGGRNRLNREQQLEALAIGVNGGVVGDLLTTIGSSVESDKMLVGESRYNW